MLSIQPTSPQKCTPNLLPARVNHNGPINNTARYWTPSVDEKGTHHTHFRGRHLHGTSVPLPSTHTGAVLRITDTLAPQVRTMSHNTTANEHIDNNSEDEDEDMEQEIPEEVKIAEQIGEFSEVIVWGHGGVVDQDSDAVARGLGEWIGFAEAMHCDEEGDEAKTA